MKIIFKRKLERSRVSLWVRECWRRGPEAI